jgi:hypothetical protein
VPTTTVAPTTTTVYATTTTSILDCSDADGDGYGDGAQCLGPDCDDDDPASHDQCSSCTVNIFPKRVWRQWALIRPVKGFLIWKSDRSAFAVDAQVEWEDDALMTKNKFSLGRKMRLLFVIVEIDPQKLAEKPEYSVRVNDCVGTVEIK